MISNQNKASYQQYIKDENIEQLLETKNEFLIVNYLQYMINIKSNVFLK